MHARAGLRLPPRDLVVDEVLHRRPNEAPAEHRLHSLRRRDSTLADATVVQVDSHDRRDVDSSSGTSQSTAAHAARRPPIGATALVSRPAARPVSFSVLARNITATPQLLGFGVGCRTILR